MSDEPFANPIAPVGHQSHVHDSGPATAAAKQPLTNEDFRKLISTPRVGSSSHNQPASVRHHHNKSQQGRNRKPILSHSDSGSRKKRAESPDEKKELYKSMKQRENDVLSELSQRYRDRAKERREGINPDYISNEELLPGMSSVAPDLKSRTDVAERRKQMIEESKFLGGDMEHTHLVKGLDYALLHKVKAELQQEQAMEEDCEGEEDEDESAVDVTTTSSKVMSKSASKVQQQTPQEKRSDELEVRSLMARNIVKALNPKANWAPRNDLFLPSRMAYVVDLDNESVQDIPITVIRSKSQCPSLDALLSHSTNDIVINKLAHIIASHRSGVRREKETASSLNQSESLKNRVKREDDVKNREWSSSSRSSISGRRSDDRSEEKSAKICESSSGLSIYEDLDDDTDYQPVRRKR